MPFRLSQVGSKNHVQDGVQFHQGEGTFLGLSVPLKSIILAMKRSDIPSFRNQLVLLADDKMIRSKSVTILRGDIQKQMFCTLVSLTSLFSTNMAKKKGQR